MVLFQVLVFSKIGVSLFSASFVFGFVRLLKLALRFWAKFSQAKVFIGQSLLLSQVSFFGKVRFPKLASRFLAEVCIKSVQTFLSGSLFLAKVLVCKVIFSASGLASLALAFWFFRSFGFSKVRLVKNCGACKIKSVSSGSGF